MALVLSSGWVLGSLRYMVQLSCDQCSATIGPAVQIDIPVALAWAGNHRYPQSRCTCEAVSGRRWELGQMAPVPSTLQVDDSLAPKSDCDPVHNRAAPWHAVVIGVEPVAEG